MKTIIVLLTPVMLGVGCAGPEGTVTRQATFDLGCTADNIEVTDIGGGGWGARGCGRKASYHCSSGFFVGAQCAKMGDVFGDAVSGTAGPAASTRDTHAEPPKGAVGFSFGATREATRTTCIGAGKSWEDGDKSSTCSGTPIDIGLAARGELTFCGEKLCTITVTSSGPELEANVGDSYTSLVDGLRKKYGAPTARAHHIADNACCSSWPCDFRRNAGSADADPLVKCARDGRATFDTGWVWPNGEQVHLVLDRVSGPLTLQIVYSAPANAIHPKAEGL